MITARRAPDDRTSNVEIMLTLGLPAALILTFFILMVSFRNWRTQVRYIGRREFILSDTSVAFAGMDATATLPWSRFTYYKETAGRFLLWRGSFWIMFPKRAFASWDDVTRCRELLDRHLQRSRWFLG